VTDTNRAVDSGNQAAKRAVNNALGSRERSTCAGRLRFKDFVIFSTMVESLFQLYEYIDKVYTVREEKKERGKEIHAPLPVVTSRGGLVYGPYVLQDELDKHGLEVAAFEVLGAEHALRLGI
jgi:hypothetical protein